MKIVFYAPEGTGNKTLVAAVMVGARVHGDEVIYVPVNEYRGVVEADAAAGYGVRISTRIILESYRRVGKRTLYFDKGYWGRGTYTRVAVNGWQPTACLPLGKSRERFGAELAALREMSGTGRVVYAATTQTWHDFYSLGDARQVDELLVTQLMAQYPGRVVYRPRPGYATKHPELAVPIAGAAYSGPEERLADLLPTCDLLVTLGSNAAVEAQMAGVATLVLGDNPLRLLNQERILREQLFADLAWCQWTLSDYLSGEAWVEIKRQMGAVR